MKYTTRQGVLIECDGVLLHKHKSNCSLSWNDFDFLPLALDALRLFAKNDIAVVVVSDQAWMRDGHLTKHEVDKLTRRMLLEIALSGGKVESVYYCPHFAAHRCFCRKPSPGLLLRAMSEGMLSPARTYFVGDGEQDMEAAERAGCRGILLRRNSFLTAETRDQDSFEIASSLYEAAERIVCLNVPRLTDVLQANNCFRPDTIGPIPLLHSTKKRISRELL